MKKLLINFLVFCQKVASICNTKIALFTICHILVYGWLYNMVNILIFTYNIKTLSLKMCKETHLKELLKINSLVSNLKLYSLLTNII